MTRSRTALAALAAVLVLLVAGVWLVPGLLDWNRYRDTITAIASARMGRTVHIGGGITLHLLPQPILTAADVTVDDDGDGITMRARALRLRVALGALLSGTVDARELTLQGADLRLPWPPPAVALARPPPAWISGLRAQVEDGRLQMGGMAFTGIDATLSTDLETGTLSAAGVGHSGAQSWQFTARLARVAHDGAAGLDLSLDGQGKLQDTGGTFSGQIGANGTITGRVAGRGPDLSQLMPAPALPWRGDGRLSAAAGLAVADELALEIGGAPARGAVALRVLPEVRLDLAIAAGRLDLDAWLPALLRRDPAVQPSLSTVLPTGIDLSAEAATWAGGTLRQVRAAIDLTPADVALREVSAILPGNATVALSGQMSGAVRQFAGSARLAAPDLRTTLRWMQAVLPGLAPASITTWPTPVLRTAELSATIVAGGGAVDLTDLRGVIDGTRISGTASVRGGVRPRVNGALVLDRLAVDDWITGDARPTTWSGLESDLARLRTMDADLKLQVAHASWGSVPLGASVLEVQTEASRVVVRRLESQPLGMTLAVSGQVGNGSRVTDGRVELSATDLGVLRAVPGLVPRLVPTALAPLLRGQGTITVQMAGPPDALATRLSLDASDLRIEAQPLLNLVAGRAAGAVTVHHPGAPRLLETLGLSGAAAWLGDGSFSLVGQMAVVPGRLELEGATLAAGSARATGRVALESGRLTGQIAAETLPLPLVYVRSPDPLPVSWLRGWQAALRLEAAQVLVGQIPVLQTAATDVSLEDGRLQLARLTGRLAGGTVTGDASFDSSAEPPRLTLRGQASQLAVPSAVMDTPLDLLAGQLDVTLDLSATGHSPAALLATLAGTGTLRARDALVQGFDLAAAGAALMLPTPAEVLAAARTALLAGTTPITQGDTRLSMERGVLTLAGTLASEAGQGTLAGSVDLRGGGQDLRLALTPALAGSPAGSPVLGLRVTGPFDRAVRTPELAGLARWLADRPSPAAP